LDSISRWRFRILALARDASARLFEWYNNAMKSTIDSAGRVVIPKPIREAAGLTPGSELEIAYRDGKIEIAPRLGKIKLLRKGSVLVAACAGAPKMTAQEANEWIRKSRDREI
jgi:AbrB family looped-hinge helix DNA binding protein